MEGTSQTNVQLLSIMEEKRLRNQQEDRLLASLDNPPWLIRDRKRTPKLPNLYLLEGAREDYLRIAVPLYEACISCDWGKAKVILKKTPELVRSSITANSETALHIASSIKGSKKVEKFVKNLVDMMEDKDLVLQNDDYHNALYMAVVAGNIELVKIMVEKNRALVTIPDGRDEEMPLYVAASFGNYKVMKYLYDYSQDLSGDGWNFENLTWLLQRCVEGDMFDMALKIVKKHQQLDTGSVLGVLARKPAAFFEIKSNFIVMGINAVLRGEAYEKESKAWQLLKIIWEDISKKPYEEIDKILRGQTDSSNFIRDRRMKIFLDFIHNLDVGTQNIMRGPPNKGTISMQITRLFYRHLRVMREEIKQIKEGKGLFLHEKDRSVKQQDLISEHLMNMDDEYSYIAALACDADYKRSYTLNLILKHISSMCALLGVDIKQYHSRVLFIAAEMGNTKFLVELICRYPELIWKVNEDGHNIFHIAVKFRHEGIYNLLYEIGSMRNLITSLKDVDENNMAHLAGKRTTSERLTHVCGAALQMQRELLWFKEVRNMIPTSLRDQMNKDGLTPNELFTKEHKGLMREGEEWMKGTASQCMVVAALIATIVFAAAFTIPGGYSQTDGIPIFYGKPIFVAFVVADAMSLFLSTVSILTFLSILTSRYTEHDFEKSLPNKLMLGVISLFLSIATMMITFAASFFILYHNEKKWVPILISVSSLVPVVLYIWLQYHVLADVARSTYGSKSLFKPKKRVLYYANPRV